MNIAADIGFGASLYQQQQPFSPPRQQQQQQEHLPTAGASSRGIGFGNSIVGTNTRSMNQFRPGSGGGGGIPGAPGAHHDRFQTQMGFDVPVPGASPTATAAAGTNAGTGAGYSPAHQFASPNRHNNMNLHPLNATNVNATTMMHSRAVAARAAVAAASNRSPAIYPGGETDNDEEAVRVLQRGSQPPPRMMVAPSPGGGGAAGLKPPPPSAAGVAGAMKNSGCGSGRALSLKNKQCEIRYIPVLVEKGEDPAAGGAGASAGGVSSLDQLNRRFSAVLLNQNAGGAQAGGTPTMLPTSPVDMPVDPLSMSQRQRLLGYGAGTQQFAPSSASAASAYHLQQMHNQQRQMQLQHQQEQLQMQRRQLQQQQHLLQLAEVERQHHRSAAIRAALASGNDVDYAAAIASGAGVGIGAGSMGMYNHPGGMMGASAAGAGIGSAGLSGVGMSGARSMMQHQMYGPSSMAMAAASGRPGVAAAADAAAASSEAIVQDIESSDVVLGDGKRNEETLSKRPGNHLFNSVVKDHRYAYWQAPSNQKLIVAKQVMDEMLSDNPECRFWVPNEDGSYKAATFEDTLRAICKALDDGKSKALRAMKKGRQRQLEVESSVQPSSTPRTPDQSGERIKEPHHNDVLLGRGKFASEHPGNIIFRQIVWEMKEEYYVARKNEKTRMVHRVIDRIKSLDPPGRFLEKDEDLLYVDAPEDRIVLKVSQALRERRWFETEKDATFRQEKKRRMSK